MSQTVVHYGLERDLVFSSKNWKEAFQHHGRLDWTGLKKVDGMGVFFTHGLGSLF